MGHKEAVPVEQVLERVKLANLRALYNRYTRHTKVVFAMFFLFIITILTVKKFKSLNEEWAYMNKLTDYINREMDRILQLETREEQNEKFRSLRPKLPIKPVRMTLSTAVFKYTSTTPTTILKRVIYNPNNGLNEDKMAMDLKSLNIVRTVSTFRTVRTLASGEQQILLWIFTELLDVKITQSTVRGSEPIIRQIIRDTLKGVKYLHSRSIAHLDLKVGNIMGSRTPDGGVLYKLIDFGYSQKMPKTGFIILKDKNYGTFPYKPPEIMFQHKHGLKSDIWSIGAIVWYLSLQYTPFYLRNNRKDVESYRKFTQDRSLSQENHRFIFNKSTSDSLKSFVKTCMKIDPADRPTAEELLEHPFVTGEPLLGYVSSSDELDDWSSDSGSSSGSV
ncbi:calcium/calmodulin-dependent protein kinase I [Pancytospora epiphaga]|nr:calcium/calmodulin-dependent protein kinase I [Pancytospora epiphaga]